MLSLQHFINLFRLMDANLLITLQNYGLSPKEAKVYLTILELGNSPASSIARCSGIKRVTIYDILKQMIEKKIISSIEKNGITYFQTVEPQKLLQRIKEKYDDFEKAMPELISLTNLYPNKPKIKYYEGIEGLKDLYGELLTTEEPIFSFLSDDDIAPELQDYLNGSFIRERRKQGLHSCVIVRDTPQNRKYLKATKKDKLTEIRLVKDELAGIEWEIMLFWENKIACALYAPKELIGYTIESKQLYASLKSIFMFMWHQLAW